MIERIQEIFRRMISWEGLGFFILLGVLYVNRFPDGHIILGADILQPINMAERFFQFHYDWSGRVSLFYSLFYFLDRIGISNTTQITWYLGLFLVGAYSSFLIFVQILFPATSRLVRFLVALFYALNPFTLYVFTATWGYSHYQVIYIFIPVLTALYLRSLSERKSYRMLLWFLFTVFCASGSFGNPAFALALGIYFFFLTISVVAFHLVPCDGALLRRLLLVGIGAVVLNLYWLFPLFPQMRSGIENVYTSEYVDLGERLRKTSNAVFDTVRLLPTSEQSKYFPSNFPYPILVFLKSGIIILTFVPFLLVLLSWLWYPKEQSHRRYRVVFSLILLVFIILVARVRFPFEMLNAFLFELPGMNTLRGWDKMATFVPFIMSVLLLISFLVWEGRKYFRHMLLFFGLVVFACGLPFFGGGIQTKLSYILSGQKAKNFELAKQSALVKIPDDYFLIADILNQDSDEFKIAMLPYSPGSSVGRVSLPAWKVNGPHPMHALSRHSFLETYDRYLPDWQFGKDFEREGDPRWITHLYGLLGVKYVLYQRDVKSESLADFQDAINSLEQSGELVRVADTDTITLYRLAQNRLFPPVYQVSKVPSVVLTSELITEGAEMLWQDQRAIPFVRMNKQRLQLPVKKIQVGQTIFQSERFDPLWQAEYRSDTGDIVSLNRDWSVRYANAWEIDRNLEGGSIVLYFIPERYLAIGEFVSGLAFIAVCLGLYRVCRKKER